MKNFIPAVIALLASAASAFIFNTNTTLSPEKASEVTFGIAIGGILLTGIFTLVGGYWSQNQRARKASAVSRTHSKTKMRVVHRRLAA